MSNLPLPIKDQELHPTHEYMGHELLRHMRKLPRLLYGIFVEVTRQFYMGADNHPIGTPIKIWRPKPDETEIWIDSEIRWEDEHPEKRPAIYIQLSPITYSSLTGRRDAKMAVNVQNSESFFTRSGVGTVSFVHIGGTAGESLALGDSTMDYLDAFGVVIRDDFCFTSFALVERIPLKLMPKESKERYGSIVTFRYELQDRWTLKLESHKLKVLTFRAGQELLAGGIVQ